MVRVVTGLHAAVLGTSLALAQPPPTTEPLSHFRPPAWREAEDRAFHAPDLGFARIGAEVDQEAAKAAEGGPDAFKRWYAAYARRLLPHSLYGQLDYGTDPERVRRRYRVLHAGLIWMKRVRKDPLLLSFHGVCDEPYAEKTYMYGWYMACGQMQYQPRLTKRLRAAFPKDIYVIEKGLESWVGASKTLNPLTYLPLVDDVKRIEREHPDLRIVGTLGLKIYAGWFAVDPGRKTHAELDRFCRRLLARTPKDRQKAMVEYLNRQWPAFDPICDRLKLPRFRFRLPSSG